MKIWIEIFYDYQHKDKTIGRLSEESIYDEINQYAENFSNSDIRQWINNLKFRKPGYVINDLVLMLRLGTTSQFGSDYTYSIDTLDLWLFEYGVKKTGGDKWEKDGGQTYRNKNLGIAMKYENEKKRDWDMHDRKYITMDEYIKRNPDSKLKTYLDQLDNKDKIKEVPKTWVDDPLLK